MNWNSVLGGLTWSNSEIIIYYYYYYYYFSVILWYIFGAFAALAKFAPYKCQNVVNNPLYDVITSSQFRCILLLSWYNTCLLSFIFNPPPPVGAGGGYMFSGRPSVPLSVRPSVIHVVVLCFHDISSICWRIFGKLLSLVHLGTGMNWLDFGVKRLEFKVTAWPSSATFSS